MVGWFADLCLRSTNKGVNSRPKYATQVQQQRPAVTLTWHTCKYSGGVDVPCTYTQVRVTVGDPGLCCCTCVAFFVRELTPLFVDSARAPWALFCFRFVFEISLMYAYHNYILEVICINFFSADDRLMVQQGKQLLLTNFERTWIM